ncbi:MAG: endonuclease Q family protein [Bacillota bacterium]
MQLYYADLHVHIGRAQGRAVKITASEKMTLGNILENGAREKGLQMVGVVDCGSPLVLRDIQELVNQERLLPTRNGDLITEQGTMLLLGVEVESCEGVHFISYLPDLNAVETWQKVMQRKVTNLDLSTQRTSLKAIELIDLTAGLRGIFVVAHAFTPHRGAYGCWVERLSEGLGQRVNHVLAIELGLSSDTDMADTIRETRGYSFLSNSDAHSLANLGREYNLLRMANLSFSEFRMALLGENGRRIMANYGLHPHLGKYHRSYCPQCEVIAHANKATFACDICGQKMVPGVWDRILAIRDYEEPHHPIGRPPYYYRVPLHFIPGLGPRTYARLRQAFGSDIEIMERADLELMKRIIKPAVVHYIEKMRNNELEIIPGGGGYYGRVKKSDDDR